MAHPSNEPNLFDIQPKQQRKQAPSAPPQTVQRLIGVYRIGYERRFHEPPVILKRDGAILKSLINQFGPDKVEQRLRAFLQWDDSFVVDSGYALTMFQSCWNRLAARCISTQSAQSDERLEKTQQYLRSLRAVPGRRAAGG